MKILGIDPGYSRIGYGIIKQEKDVSLIACGTIEISENSRNAKLLELQNRFGDLLQKVNPDVAGIETLYFSKNQKTALAVAEARGILMLSVSHLGIPIYECRPQEVKQSVSGYGLADKKTVAAMVCRILGITNIEGHDDATDALAIAITAANIHAFKSKLNNALM